MNRRWYDREPVCSNLIVQLKNIQQPIVQDFCAKMLIHFCERIRKELAAQDKVSSRVKSLGVNALPSLYKAQSQRNRWYDHLPEVQKAVGQVYTLSHQGLSIVGYKLGDTFGMLQIYATVCHQLEQTPSQQEMTNITMTALQSGKSEAEDTLVSIIGQELYTNLTERQQKKPGD